MRQFSALIAILSSVFVLIIGNGLMNTLVSYRAKVDHFPDIAIGLIGSLYFVGMLAGTVAAPFIIRRAGYIRAFAALTTISVIAALAFPVALNPYVWMVLRALIGFCFAGLYAVIEVWVNASAEPGRRGHTYALYQLVTFAGSTLGQQVFSFGDAQSYQMFSAGAVFFALAILPMAFTTSDPPSAPNSAKFRLFWLMKQSPIGAAAALIVGCCNGTFWSLAAVYGIGIGLSAQNIGLFTTFIVLGSAIAVWPFGRLSDRLGRRVVLLGLVLASMAMEIVMVLLRQPSISLLCGVGFFLGGFMFSQYSQAITHTTDRVGPEHSLQVSAGLLALYCIGAILGPVAASSLMLHYGPQMLFAQAAAVHAALALFIAYRMREKPAPAATLQSKEPSLAQ